MAIDPVQHPKKKRIRFVAASAVAVTDPRYKAAKGAAPTVLNAVLLDQHGHAWFWDGVAEGGFRMRMGTRKSIRTQRTDRNK